MQTEFWRETTAIFWAQDQDRSVVLRDYVWTLYEQQDVVLRDLFPVPRPRIKQSFDRMELSAGGQILAGWRSV
jgi:hypothetical protein